MISRPNLKKSRAALITCALTAFALCLAALPNRSASAQATPQAIGLETGVPAPAFEATDQSGRLQTNDTLKGPKGTVLLFFRSADW